ncbi:MAG: SWIM zinc finger family protein [Planctomycetes bacterium]|nr:SWIM zinc finger family protein [Planctomycetota bacterium]
MPQDIETALTKAGLSLFPKSLKEIETDCSCPDWSNPCKHIAAVYYLLGEEFDRDPFLLFRLRGTDRERICGRLSPTPSAKAEPAEKTLEPVAKPEPLLGDAATFRASPSLPADLCGEVRLRPASAAGLKQLGGFPFWRGTERFLEALAPTHPAAAQRGLALFESERSSPSEGPSNSTLRPRRNRCR